MRRFLVVLLVLTMLLPLIPASAQDGCGTSRLEGTSHAQVVAGVVAPVYDVAGGPQIGSLMSSNGAIFLIDPSQCINGVYWAHVAVGDFYDNWMPETVDGMPVLEPYQFIPAPPVALGVPMTDPVISNPQVPLPAVKPAPNPATLETPYARWDWAAIIQDAWYQPPDPLALQLPDAYAGDLPVPPVNLDEVYFVQDANLTPKQLALLAQNGFVVVPGNVPQFDQVYQDDTWPHQEGQGDFITTDALLHSLFLTYQNALMFLEKDAFYGRVANFVAGGYEAAQAQVMETVGTPLEGPARNAAAYYAVALLLLADGEPYYTVGVNQESGFREGDRIPSQVLAQANPNILVQAQPVVDMARAAEGRLKVPMLDDYEEDFSQYKPRSYYAGDPLLEAYFRGMMWLGRITFRAKSDADTLAGLLALRALNAAPGAYSDWTSVADTLTFLVGPMDDYSPVDYQPLAESVFGAGLPLDALADPAKLDAFLAGVAELPGPRINSLPLPIGITAEEVDAFTRGFRLFGQRFTLDGYIMQQLIYPEVGTAQNSRALPLGLDVPAALGSDIAFALADEAGATGFANYTENMAALREEVNGLDGSAWMENLYGGWLWALQPLLVRDPDLVPPMMQTDAWKRKDIHTSLGSWTELKHATLLYAEQPMGGLGGGGMVPPITSYSYVEPNPLVFARIAIVAATLDQGLETRGFYSTVAYAGLSAVRDALNSLTILSARLAEIARKEIAGEPVSEDELLWMQEYFGGNLWNIRYTVEEWVTNPPETVALVADVASNASAGTVLEVGIGPVDYIYVITHSPYGLQLTRGGVYSYQEFEWPIDQRLTDDEWRAMLANNEPQARPWWIDLYFSGTDQE
jgi:hypothetical protein